MILRVESVAVECSTMVKAAPAELRRLSGCLTEATGPRPGEVCECVLSRFELLSTAGRANIVKSGPTVGERGAEANGAAAVLSRLTGSRADDLIQHLGHEFGCDQECPVDQSITILPAQLLCRDEIESVTERSGTGGRRGRSGRFPHGESGGIFSQDVTTVLFITERERFLSPVDDRVVLLEPRHSENDVEAAELSGDEVDRLGVGADADGCPGQDATGRGGVTVCKADSVGMLGESEAVLGSEGRRNEIARSAAVDEHDCGVRAEGARELDESAAGQLGDGVSARVRER